jgi:hypothetical protein
MPHLIQPGTGEHSAYCPAAGLGDQTDNQPDERMECRGGEARAELGTLTRTVNERPMLASSRSKIHEPRVIGVSPRPTDQRQRQKLRNTRDLGDRADRFRFLIRDRDSKFTMSFDAVFASADMRIIRTPIRAPRANAIAERFIGTLRRECLDHLLIIGPRHLDVVLSEYV